MTLDSSSDDLERTVVEDDRRSKSISIREQVNLNQTKAANKMIIKHDHKRNKKTTEYKIGDGVSAKIPKVDVGGTEMPRVAGVVTDKVHDKYQITTEWGILADKLRAEHLEPYNGLLDLDKINKITNTISIREAAAAAAGRSKKIGDIEIECDCTGKCVDRRCKCFKNELKCNSHCHGKKSLNKNCCENNEKKSKKKK